MELSTRYPAISPRARPGLYGNVMMGYINVGKMEAKIYDEDILKACEVPLGGLGYLSNFKQSPVSCQQSSR